VLANLHNQPANQRIWLIIANLYVSLDVLHHQIFASQFEVVRVMVDDS
jgi:hypothetical protein